jgi:hypothetical protein
MASRLAAMRAFPAVLDAADLDLAALRSFGRPVYFALGGSSNPDLYRRIAQRLAETFPDFTLEVFADRHHFDPPHRIEPARLAAALRSLWDRAESGER